MVVCGHVEKRKQMERKQGLGVNFAGASVGKHMRPGKTGQKGRQAVAQCDARRGYKVDERVLLVLRAERGSKTLFRVLAPACFL